MSKRGIKIAMLMLSGGVLLQVGSCVSLLVQQAASTAVSTLFSQLISGIVDATNTTP